jgi:acyl-CoA synthetase (AMP-forming)/AMP-acid ligase II
MNLIRNYRLSRDRSLTVANLVDRLLASRGDAEISIEQGRPRRLAELHREICAIHAFLLSAGLRPGDRVAVYRANDPLCFRWFLAIIRAGGIAVPLNPQLSLPELRAILQRSAARILVTDRAVFESTIRHRAALDVETWIQADSEPVTLDGFLRVPASSELPPPVSVAPSATIAVFHTSGTSGFPKGASLSSRALLGARSISLLVAPFLSSRDLALVALPWSHVMAVSIALYGLLAGVRGCFLDHFDAAAALDLVERHRVTAFVGVPAMFARLVNSNPAPRRLASIRLWLSASDHLPSAVRARLRSFGALRRLPFGCRIPPLLLNGYGMVELGGLAMLGVESMLFPGSGDLCFPVPPHRIRIAAADGRPLPPGALGELQIFRPGLAAGYWGDPARDSELLTPDGWLRTGDSAVRNRLGLVRLAGRIKDVIKSGGYSVYVRELEESLSAHPAVARAAGFGLPHPEKGEVPAAAVELLPGALASEDGLLAFCRLSLAPYKAPRRIWILPPGGLPQNHTGKTLRRVLRERFSSEAAQ